MQGGQKLAEEAVALYEKATSRFLKNNLMLHFAYADFEEVSLYLLIVKKKSLLVRMVFSCIFKM